MAKINLGANGKYIFFKIKFYIVFYKYFLLTGGQADEKKVMEYGFDAIFMEGDNKSEK